MKITMLGLAVVLTVLPLAAVHADDTRSQIFLEGLGNGTTDQAVEDDRNRIEVSALKDSSRVSIKLASTASRTAGPAGKEGLFSTWSLTASAPVSKSDDATDLATLDGFTNAFKLELKFTRFVVKREKPKLGVDEEATKRFEGICSKMRAGFRAATGATEAKAKELECDSGNVATYAKGQLARFQAIFWDQKKVRTVWGAAVSAGDEDFKYVNPADLTDRSQSENPWSARIFFGLLPPKWKTLMTFGAEYQESYKNATSGTRCGPPDDNDFSDCKTGPLGEPVDSDKELLFFEVRRALGKLALSPRLTHDADADVLGIDVPVYLVRDSKRRFNGGVRFGWRDDTDDLSIGVFVGSAFSVFE